MKLLKLSDLTHFWGNVRKHIPTKTSDLTNDSNFAVDSNVVHNTGAETISGVKTFSDDTYVKNINFTREVASPSASTTSVLQLINTVTYTDQTANKVAILNFRVTADGTKALYPNENNQYALGLQSRKWSEVHAMTYYYGSSDVEFSDKFVTTDTAQTVSGVKTFLDVPISFKSSTAELGVSGGNTKVIFTDKNLLNLAGITLGNYGSSKLSYCRFHIYDKDSNNQEIENFIEFSYVNNNQVAYFRPNKSNFVTLGTVNNRWTKVYADEYYYGLNNVEFSTKFVTSDTAQTVSGQKVFSSNTYIYNSDATANTPNLYLRNSKIELSSQGNTSGDQNLAYLDKNNTNYAYIKGAIQSNGSAVKIRAIAKDSSDNSVINELQMLAYTNGNKAIFPSYSNEIDLGTSSYKWKSFNGVTPSSLSLPMTRDSAIDIASYFTNFSSADTNSYAVNTNGWIYLETSGCNALHCFCMTSGGLTHYAHTVARTSDGMAYITFPVLANTLFKCTWYTNSTITLNRAWFIPCQGNV